MALEKITDHADQAQARNPEQFKGKEVYNAVIRAVGLEVQDFEDAVYPMFDLLNIDTQIGAQLDGIGEILTTPRDGKSDVDYRVALKEAAASITASGTPEQVIERFITLAEPAGQVNYIEDFPAGYCIGSLPLTHDDVQSGGSHSALPDLGDPNLHGAWLNSAVQGTPDDYSASGDDMTENGAPTYPADQGITLAGNPDYLFRTENAWRGLDTLGTISGRIQMDAIGPLSQTLFTNARTAASNRYLTVFVDNAGFLHVAQQNEDTIDDVRGSTVLSAGVEYHVTVVSTGSGYLLYVNAVAETLTVVTGGNFGDWFFDSGDLQAISIGAFLRTGAQRYLEGTIQDVRYYSDVRTPAEILADYNAGLIGPVVDLVTGGIGTADEYVGGFITNVTRDETYEILSHDDDSVEPDGSLATWVDTDVLFLYSLVATIDILSAMEGASPVGVYVGMIDLLALEDDDLFLLEDGDTLYVTYDSSGR